MPTTAFDISSRLSDVVETTLKEGPQIVTKDGAEAAVLVPIEEWRRVSGRKFQKSGRTLKEILLDPNGPHDICIPPRGRFKLRPPFKFED
jgi:antitoxin Phd